MIEIKGNEIYTERLYMRKLRKEDLDNYYEIMKRDEVGKWLATGRGKTYEETEALIEKFTKHWEEKGYGTWALVDKKTGSLLGHCGLNYLQQTNEIEVLYAINPKYWGCGYATEAAKASIDYGFKMINLKKIITLAFPENKGSRGVMEKCGLKYIGIKEYFNIKCVYYEILN